LNFRVQGLSRQRFIFFNHTTTTTNINKNMVLNKDKCQEAFHLYDTRATGKIEIDQLGTLLRACGKSPTNAEVEDFKKQLGANEFDFNQFYQIFEQAKSYTREEIYKCFQIFDKDQTGKVLKAHLVNVLTNVGEKLTRDEVDKILDGVVVDSEGYLNYREFVDKKLMPENQ